MPEASRGKSIGMWVVSVLLAALFVFAGAGKVMGSAETVKGFEEFDVVLRFEGSVREILVV